MYLCYKISSGTSTLLSSAKGCFISSIAIQSKCHSNVGSNTLHTSIQRQERLLRTLSDNHADLDIAD